MNAIIESHPVGTPRPIIADTVGNKHRIVKAGRTDGRTGTLSKALNSAQISYSAVNKQKQTNPPGTPLIYTPPSEPRSLVLFDLPLLMIPVFGNAGKYLKTRLSFAQPPNQPKKHFGSFSDTPR